MLRFTPLTFDLNPIPGAAPTAQGVQAITCSSGIAVQSPLPR